MNNLVELTAKFRVVWPLLDERTRRLMAASEAKALGYGGVSLVRRACGLSRKAISKGIDEIEEGVAWKGRVRRPGAGRKSLTISDPRLVGALEAMIDSQTRERVVVSGDADTTLSITVPVDQMDRVTTLLRDAGLEYWVKEYTLSLNGRPPVSFVNVRRGTDPIHVQQLLDAAD